MPTPSSPPVPMRLVDVLRALPEGELQGLTRRLGLFIDPQKRLDPPSQVARALVSQPDVRDPSGLPPMSIDLLQRLVEARGRLLFPSLPPGLEPLAAKGIVFARMTKSRAIELILPSAFLVQLRVWEREDPRSLRVLLVQASFETTSAIASHYLGRPATPPLPLALEHAWEVLSSPTRLEEEIQQLPPQESRLLEAIEREGGEVLTEELLDLEREPMRLRTATGAAPSRRGTGFALERRGFLIPIHPNRHLIPSEVAEIVGRSARGERQANRQKIKTSVLASDYLPRRARFAEDPSALAAALAMSMRENNEFRGNLGFPRSLTSRLAQRFGREAHRVSMIAALSRAAGLWSPSALHPGAEPGRWPLGSLGAELFRVWRKGGAWDEAREFPEIYRLPAESREPSPSGQLRELLLDALQELGEGRWVPWRALAAYIRDDTRALAVGRLLRRWGERQGIPVPEPVDLVRRMTFESLHGLGLVDLGDPEATEGDEVEPAVRLTSRGRAMLQREPAPIPETQSTFLDEETLRVSPSTPLALLLQIFPIADFGRITDDLELIISQTTISRALAQGFDGEKLQAQLGALAPLPESLVRHFAQASVVLAQAAYVPASAFLWIEDDTVRDMLLSRRPTSDLFLDPSPAGGLLVAPGVDLERLVRRCRSLGVEITQEGKVLRVGSTTPPPSAVGEAPPRRKSVPPRRSA
ncbi:MAG: hypothetical protein RMJ98_18460 [Myxococcales bacterium]|nr:hypothetical protein [Polyangiaceae bacterium]MDW8251282.1 hypothetical protein [Myxococcales bacterium]